MKKLYLKILLLLFFMMLIISCSSSTESTKYDNTEGKLIETGEASWYGPNFDGKQTANGEIFDMYELTAAHRTLPFGSIVRVVNKSNGKSVIVRINDRGPFARNRIIDLSKKAAEKIDMIKEGTARVDLYLLNNKSLPKKIDVPHYSVQVGSFRNIKDANKLKSKINNSRIVRAIVDNKIYYRVFVGLFEDINEAKELQNQLSANGIDGFVKQVEN